MAQRFNITQLNCFVCQKPQCPFASAVWRLRAGQSCKAGFHFWRDLRRLTRPVLFFNNQFYIACLILVTLPDIGHCTRTYSCY